MSLRVPLVVWTGVPSHQITCTTTSYDNQIFATGTSTGACCKWIRDSSSADDTRLLPQLLFIPTSCSPCISLVILTVEQTSFLISCLTFLLPTYHCFILFSYTVQQNQDISIWDLSDGSCHASLSFPGGGLTRMSSISDHLIALYGTFNVFHLFDPFTLTVQHTCAGHTKWVRDVQRTTLHDEPCLFISL